MNNVREKLKNRLDELEAALNAGKHLDIKNGLFQEVLPLVESLSKYFRIMSDEDRDFFNAAKYAIEEQKEWK